MIISEYVIRHGKPFPVSGLSKGSNIKVKVKCDICETIREVMYASVIRAGHTNCQKCKVTEACEKPITAGKKYNSLTFIEKRSGGLSLFKCDCGNDKEINTWNVRNSRTKSCGCARKSNRIHADITGENHPNWNGGSSSERDRFMQSAIYKAWRLDVFERDNFTCKKCNQVGGKLEAHHIEPYHSNHELRVEESNGVTLCKNCHSAFHNEYGRKGFTSWDYFKFLES